ncbi:MAG: DUF1727 domain-containing protein [Acidimicrobiales bacterium]|nr:DUF1727 domain-containing protein [Acidimicrobiales bacterium]
MGDVRPGRPAPLADGPSRRPLRLRVAVPVAAAAARVSRLAGAGRGSVIGGRVLLASHPDAIGHLAAGHEVSLVSGTNGKTTTTRLLATLLAGAEPTVCSEVGANLPSGIASTLARAAPGARAALEVDERHLPAMLAATCARTVTLLNLSRDQLDRMNEVRMTAERWRAALEGADVRVVANADDPLVAWAAAPARVTWVAAGSAWREDAVSCPACGDRLVFDGPVWACSGCGLARPAPSYTLHGGRLLGPGGLDLALAVDLPGRHTRANAAMAVATVAALGLDAAALASRLGLVSDVDGRYRRLWGPGTEGRLYLAKNPAGWAELLGVTEGVARPLVFALNANGPDGRDPSWIWDVPFERLAGRRVIATGERSADLAVRLRYAGVAHRREPSLAAALAEARATDADVVGTYTAFNQVKGLLGERGSG